jgi:hypothetical protein
MMEVYFDDNEHDIPKIEEEIVLILAKFEDANLAYSETRRIIARAVHLKLYTKNYINREVLYEKER